MVAPSAAWARGSAAAVSDGRTAAASGGVGWTCSHSCVEFESASKSDAVARARVLKLELNMRRFEQRATETLVIGQVLDREVRLKETGVTGTIYDVGMEQARTVENQIGGKSGL